MFDILVNRPESGMTLLFWRSLSDFGVALRFLFTYELNSIVCDNLNCYVTGGNSTLVDDGGSSIQATSDANCGFPSAFLEFFEIASEMWFLIVAIDMLSTLFNPFSSTKSR